MKSRRCLNKIVRVVLGTSAEGLEMESLKQVLYYFKVLLNMLTRLKPVVSHEIKLRHIVSLKTYCWPKKLKSLQPPTMFSCQIPLISIPSYLKEGFFYFEISVFYSKKVFKWFSDWYVFFYLNYAYDEHVNKTIGSPWPDRGKEEFKRYNDVGGMNNWTRPKTSKCQSQLL